MDRKSILITGCSTGIGRTLALSLHHRGYQVISTARKEKDIEVLTQEGLHCLYLDYRESHSIEKALENTLKLTDGRLNALINNGGYGQVGAVEDLPREALREQFETNVFGWHELTKLVIPVMRKQGHGRILFNSSVLGFVAMQMRGAYVASKFALEGFVDTLRLELADTDIQLSLIEPGPILSQFRYNALKALEQNIDWQNSIHLKSYQKALSRLNKPGPGVPFTLPPEAVLRKVIKALESHKAKPRYHVTTPTHLFAFFKRVLSTKLLDRLLKKVGS